MEADVDCMAEAAHWQEVFWLWDQLFLPVLIPVSGFGIDNVYSADCRPPQRITAVHVYDRNFRGSLLLWLLNQHRSIRGKTVTPLPSHDDGDSCDLQLSGTEHGK